MMESEKGMNLQRLNQRSEAFLLNSLRLGCSLPDMVFSPKWKYFYFFPADAIFDGGFPDVAHRLAGPVNAPVWLTPFSGGEVGAADALKINSGMPPESYRNLLKGKGPSEGWLYWITDYCCFPETECWFIYCERENDIAIVAFVDLPQNLDALNELGAALISDILNDPQNAHFPFSELVPEWREKLLIYRCP